MQTDRIIAFVMAGGQGSRLQPLTAARSKPSVPFGSRYRIVDFVLSNLVNSQIRTIYLLVQYKSQSLIEHVRKSWTISPLLPDQFVTVVPPQMMSGESWFQGTSDAVYQNMGLIETHAPDLVVVFGADHIYRMDIRQMVAFHKERDADVTIAALPVPLRDARGFGIISADPDGRVEAFQEKPANPNPILGDSERAFASMGNYIFRTDVLMAALEEAHRNGETDFGGHILPRLLRDHRLFAYDFATNEVPGIKSYEQRVYWRDVGTLDAYFDAHKDVLGDEPVFDMFNPQWPIFSSNYQGPVARVLGGELHNSLLGAASVVHDGVRIRDSIIRREAVIEDDVELDECIVMDYTRIGRGAKLRRVIVDRHNHIQPGERIGFDPDTDRQRFQVSESGVTVVPRGRGSYFARGPIGGIPGGGYAE
ncbi:Glucose-1-phosphate adenylyltransferase [Thioalkalivibrio nitratireducens DSM 14787]|uniref:Glucose-1-phosphate adenylyltransferase n=1 Tax=Thioalkalivibrio nitratireducens (strain DSM 14787 / UNIQEM 213 / ALEN2) TaxID=1255043 RepID=L0DV73_THIND|nr:glucose-1-phosphate adenylyltransferase [Thioalkalivibrio nitratireducens]AGA32870.1 Glucose-1-phosphate adenylyltransferase [Thioalkalivibrio nitratireducens DSM 14787]